MYNWVDILPEKVISANTLDKFKAHLNRHWVNHKYIQEPVFT